MSTTTDEIPVARPIETAPSAIVAESASTARVIGTAGLFFLVLGCFAVGAHRISSTPRMIGEGYGFIAAAFGLALMLYHAARDNEPEMRRIYGLFAVIVMVIALAAGLVPGPVFSQTVTSEMGSNLPWGVAFGVVGLLFLTLFLRNETEPAFANPARGLLLVAGAAIVLGTVIAGAIYPNFLAGPGVALSLLGLGFLCSYFGNVDTNDGFGYRIAYLLGAFGLVVAFAALARTIFPAVLLEGPQALKKPNGAFDAWKLTARGIGVLAFLAPAAIAFFTKASRSITLVLAVIWLVGAGVLVVGSVSSPVKEAMTPFLVPRGVILFGLGSIFLAVSLGICAESQFVTLVRRELAAYFMSPIGFLVLLGMAVVQWIGYYMFVDSLLRNAGMSQMGDTIPEPIVRYYFVSLLPVLALLVLVPAITMRLIAEERRSGSLELLFTAPVSETTVVLSKFLATWFFFLITWLPAGLFLITLRVENGEAFDYRPLLSFYLGLAACGAGFVAMGLFFSSISPNQVVSAVLTFVGMVLLVACYLFKERAFGLGPTFQAIMTRLSFIDLWRESLNGQLSLRDVFAWLSLAVFWLFATVKVLEARRWR
jgi:ABC-2 type transport system permease protein